MKKTIRKDRAKVLVAILQQKHPYLIKTCKFCFSKYISAHWLYYVALLSCMADSTQSYNYKVFLLCSHTCSVCFLWRSDWKVSVIIQLRLMLSAGLSIDNPFIYEQLGLLLHSTYSHLLEIRSNTEEIFFLLYQRIEMSWWINTGTVKIGGRHVFCVF